MERYGGEDRNGAADASGTDDSREARTRALVRRSNNPRLRALPQKSPVFSIALSLSADCLDRLVMLHATRDREGQG